MHASPPHPTAPLTDGRSRFLVALVALLVAALFLGACGEADEPAQSTADNEATATAAADGMECIDVPNTDGSFAAIQESGALRVGAVDGLLPYSSSNPDQPGFEQEMAQYVADQLCVEMEPVFVSWDGLIPGLTSDRYDVIFNGIFITDDRREAIEFSLPYYASGETILVQAGNPEAIEDIDDLRDRRVGVLSGSVTIPSLEERGVTDLQIYDDQQQIIMEVNNGRIAAGYLEAPSSAWAVSQDRDLNVEIVEGYVPPERYNAGVGIRQDDTDLRLAINLAVSRLVTVGPQDEIFDRYGVPYYPVR